MPTPSYQERLVGLLVGGAVGDAVGLPMEGLSPCRIARMWPGDLDHHFFLGRGMISDDTEHALMTANALIESGGAVNKFRQQLAWKLRWWIIGMPAGVGLATAKACLRLWIGIPPDRSGVRSAGNGPAMRSAVIGARYWQNIESRRSLVSASTRLTHSDRRAETAALAVAEAAAWIVANKSSREFISRLPGIGEDDEWFRAMELLHRAAEANVTVSEFAARLGLSSGVSGFAYHSIPVALYSWIRHDGDFLRTVESVVRCGGDTDTVASIAGSLAGCQASERGIPSNWRDGVKDWPRSIRHIRRVGECLYSGQTDKSVSYFWPGVLPRNMVFLIIVLFHGFRRLLPPYANHQLKG